MNPDKLPDDIFSDLCHNLGIDPGEDLAGRRIAKMPPEEVLERVLTWHGIIGYGEKVMRWVHVIEHAND